MTTEERAFLIAAAREALARLAAFDNVDPEMVAELVLSGALQWQHRLPDGQLLTLLRLYSPVGHREEVFLGGALFNDFVIKTLAQSAQELGYRVAAVTQDLERAYLLVRGQPVDVVALGHSMRDAVTTGLPDLLLGPESVDRGVYGDPARMLTFYKCNIDPFPVFVIPGEGIPRLVSTVSNWLHTLLTEDGARALAKAANIPLATAESWRVNVVLSLLSYFFCRDGREMQSPHHFLRVAMKDGRLAERATKAAFGVAAKDDLDKATFYAAKKGGLGVHWSHLAEAVDGYLAKLSCAIEGGESEEVAPHLTEKAFDGTWEVLADLALSNVQLGPELVVTGASNDKGGLACRLCGGHVARIPERNIVGGLGTGGRFNQSLRRSHERFCPRCALSSYLINRRLGMQFDSGGFPIPKLYNIVFHYGRHQDWEIVALQRQIEIMLQGVQENKPASDLLRELAHTRLLVRAEMEGADVVESYDDPVAELGRLAEQPDPIIEVSANVLAQMQQDIRPDVLALGAGSERLLVFVLPQLRPGRKEGMDYVQRRFSRGRLAAFTLLAFLRRLTADHGPWYFQSLPRLALGGLQPDHFYIRNRAEPVGPNLRRYSAIADFARRVVRYQDGHSTLADWIKLADRVLADPLGTFSEVLRASPVRAGDDFGDPQMRYKRLSSDWQAARGLGVVDSSEYLALYRMLTELAKGGQAMPKQVAVESVATFCDHLFRALDRGGLLPIRLGEAPHAFEKYPRLLIGLLGRYEQPETALAEWEAKVLRSVHASRRDDVHCHLQDLREWLAAGADQDLFQGEGRRDNLNHLKRSLYGRIYAWLYPRRKLAAAYAQTHIGAEGHFDAEAVAERFLDAVSATCHELGVVPGDPVTLDAQAFLVAHRSYYASWKAGEESSTDEDTEQQAVGT